MRAHVLALILSLVALPALAETIAPNEAKNHIGQSLTVEGVVSEVHHAASGKAIFLDIGGHYPDQQFTAIIFAGDFDKFPKMDSLEGKTVDITGTVKRHQGQAEIVLTDPTQVRAK